MIDSSNIDIFFEANPNPMWIYEPDSLQIKAVNKAALTLYDYSRQEMLSMTIGDLRPHSELEKLQQEVDKQKHELNNSGIWLHKNKNGERLYVQVTSYPINWKNIPCKLVVGQDVTQQKDVEEELKVAEEKLRQLYIEEKNFSEELEKKVKERTRQLENTNEELESFSYSVSHDLRTPLRAIDGYTTLLIEDYYEQLDEDGQEFLTIISEEVKRMGELIDDLLAFSRLNRKEKVGQRFPMRLLVKNSIDEVRQAFPEARPEIELGELPEVVGDPNLLKRVWVNLIGNGIKYQPEGQTPRLKIGCKEDPQKDQIFFYVKDNGVGFKMKYADKLFGVFQRLHSDDEFDGTGIGLALVRRIVNRHGGEVWAESVIGKGSTFYFSLPNSPASGHKV